MQEITKTSKKIKFIRVIYSITIFLLVIFGFNIYFNTLIHHEITSESQISKDDSFPQLSHNDLVDNFETDSRYLSAKSEIDLEVETYTKSKSKGNLENLENILTKYETSISIDRLKEIYDKLRELGVNGNLGEYLSQLNIQEKIAVYAMFTPIQTTSEIVQNSNVGVNNIKLTSTIYNQYFTNSKGCKTSRIYMYVNNYIFWKGGNVRALELSYDMKSCADGTIVSGTGFDSQPTCNAIEWNYHCGDVSKSECKQLSQWVYSCYYHIQVTKDYFAWGFLGSAKSNVMLDASRYTNGTGVVYYNDSGGLGL